ncbi:efflux RND transporter periplasmic adaptor subunit [Marilutibacter alkalisoli]|uniref:Efflux RND transporter periplasmic adaptor subunit n=1 Tax=Marilutibacter alkalisoli TaxID=2591633 RepID=A0A514BP83_9GAMM|nr:efflux RND transporter periplasmic adaptor subunit [Lysobacter alkalisoli]QDH69193.1 efflux RND transporter periplasmic adaptor subunit [Lysobacter alkalisoli]
MRTRFHVPAVLAGLLVALAGCSDDSGPESMPPLAQLETMTVEAGRGIGGRGWDGVVEAVQQADLSAQTGGRITTITVDVDDRVEQGQVLLRITEVEQQAGARMAQAALRAAEAAVVEAESNYRRFAALEDSQYVSRAQLDQARAARDSAMAARDAARADLAQAGRQTEYTVVRAPFAGIVSARRVEPGETVVPGQSLFSMHAPGALRIEVQVPQSEAAAIRAAGRAIVMLDDGRRVEAARLIVFPAAEPATHSVGVRVLLPDLEQSGQPAPQPGVTAKVLFPAATEQDADQGVVRVPYSALVQRGEVSGVYVLADDRLSLRQVRLGRRSGAHVGDGGVESDEVESDEVEVLAGLKPGERIATDPVAALQALAAQREAGGARP